MTSVVTDRVSGIGGAVSPPAVSTLPPGGASPALITERVSGYGSGTGLASTGATYIEPRTSDPDPPITVGRIWLRIDL